MENKRVRVHISLDPHILKQLEEYKKRLVGNPTSSGIIETALENLFESEGVGKPVENFS